MNSECSVRAGPAPAAGHAPAPEALAFFLLPLLLQLKPRLVRPLQELVFSCSGNFPLGEQEQSLGGIPMRSGGSGLGAL